VRTGRPLIVSTGMSTIEEIHDGVEAAERQGLLIAHAASTYPCPVGQLNLRMIHTLEAAYAECPMGYSGHETGAALTCRPAQLSSSPMAMDKPLDLA